MASEYQNTIASATGDSTPHSGLSMPRREDEHDRRHDHEDRRFAAVMAPRGISRIAVRGIERVEPRVDQAVEAHRRAARRHHRDDDPDDVRPVNGVLAPASSAPVSANGSANTEWVKRTNER